MAEGLRSLPAFQQTAPLYVKILPQKAVADMLGHSERLNELCYNYSMAENAEKKRALEEMFSKVFIFSEYVSENKKIGNG